MLTESLCYRIFLAKQYHSSQKVLEKGNDFGLCKEAQAHTALLTHNVKKKNREQFDCWCWQNVCAHAHKWIFLPKKWAGWRPINYGHGIRGLLKPHWNVSQGNSTSFMGGWQDIRETHNIWPGRQGDYNHAFKLLYRQTLAFSQK